MVSQHGLYEGPGWHDGTTEATVEPTLATLLATLVLWIDSFAGYDFAASILYMAVLVLVSAAGTGKAVARATQLCVLLTIAAWSLVHIQHPAAADMLRCLFACIAIAVTGALLVSRQRLEATQRDLERSRAIGPAT